MYRWIKIFVKVVIFCIALTTVLRLAQGILKSKFVTDSTRIVNGFYEEKKNSIDLLVMGSSNSFCTIDPLVLYEDYGIRCYDFGSSSQPMNITYLYVQEALKRQKPKVIALEVNMIPGGAIEYGGEDCKRWGYTDIPLSINKIKNMYDFIGSVNFEFWSYVFPILGYHTRWKEIYKIDFTYPFESKIDHDKGFYRTDIVSELPIDLSGYMCEGEEWIADSNILYLEKIIDLCNKNGVELFLFKSPKKEWYNYDTIAIRDIASKRGLDFIDYNEIIYKDPSIINLDCTKDFRDNLHVNEQGAKKITKHFGKYLQNNYNFENKRTINDNNTWNQALYYYQRKGHQPFMDAEDGQTCWDELMKEDNYIVVITKNEKTDIIHWIYDSDELVFSTRLEENGLIHKKIGKKELIISKFGVMYQMLIDGEEYYNNEAKWSFIVYDKVLNEIVAKQYYNF